METPDWPGETIDRIAANGLDPSDVLWALRESRPVVDMPINGSARRLILRNRDDALIDVWLEEGAVRWIVINAFEAGFQAQAIWKNVFGWEA